MNDKAIPFIFTTIAIIQLLTAFISGRKKQTKEKNRMFVALNLACSLFFLVVYFYKIQPEKTVSVKKVDFQTISQVSLN